MNGQSESVNSAQLQGAIDFLKRILPQDGFKVAYVVAGTKKWNSFFATVEALAAFIIQQDQLGRTTYHACSSFVADRHDAKGTPRAQRRLGRTQHNVAAAQALWADVDCGEGKPYPSQLDGANHVAAFVSATGLPTPLYVSSGNGLHLYWPLDVALDPATWRRYATGLAALFARHGLQVDTTRTQDLSSVLRTPGTHHRKQEVKEVVAGPLVGPYPLQLFERLLDVGTKGQVLPRVRSALDERPLRGLRGVSAEALPVLRNGSAISRPLVQAGPRASIAADLVGGIYDDQPASARCAARQCRQLASLAETPGAVSEPIWHAALGVLAHCDDGRDTAHQWAAPAWHGAVDEKLERLAGFGPTTCAKFASLNPAGCIGCRHSGHITSPIQLGRDRQDQREDDRATVGGDDSPPWATTQTVPATGSELPDPPTDFRYDSEGRLHHATGAKNGGISYELVCEYPIYLKAIQTAELDEGRYGLVFREKKKEHKGWRDIVVSARQALGRDATTELAERGVTIHDGELWRKFVKLAVDKWHRENDDVERRYDQFGWKDGETAFLVGKRLYTSDQVLPATGSPTLENRSQYLAIQTKTGASFERWQKAANKLFAAGLEHQSLALLCGFAAPLMRFHAEGEGGAIVAFVSDRTASGKTTALEAAASIWGAHKGLKLDETDTRVAKGLKLGILGNLPCTFDELHKRDPELIRDFVLTFTNGADRDRGTTDGGLKVNKSEWQTILLLASNTSIVDKLSNMDTSDASAARILEVITALPSYMEKDDWDEIRRELNFNHGFAGDIYMKKLVQPECVEWIRSEIPKRSAQLRKDAGLDEKHRFWVRLVVSVILAGEIVSGCELLDFSTTRIEKWLTKYVAEIAGTISATTHDAASMLSAAMSDHQRDMLTVDGEYKAGRSCYVFQRPLNRLLGRYEKQTNRVFFSEVALKKWLVDKGINTRGFFATLKEQGVILREARKVTLGAGTDQASGQTPCVVINTANPLVSGMVASLEDALPEQPAKTRAQRIEEAQK